MMGPPLADVRHKVECAICGNELHCRWTDSHGVGACLECGAPYRLYHYDENKQFVDKAPELLIMDDWVPVLQRYWQDNHRNVDPGAFNFPGSSYEVATQKDVSELSRWFEQNFDGLPASVRATIQKRRDGGKP